MKGTDFGIAVREEMKTCWDLLIEKGKEYSEGDEDRLINFKRSAGLQGCTQKQALFGMLCKHLASLSEMIMSDEPYSQDRWKEKITDSINYLLILYAMVQEEKKWKE